MTGDEEPRVMSQQFALVALALAVVGWCIPAPAMPAADAAIEPHNSLPTESGFLTNAGQISNDGVRFYGSFGGMRVGFAQSSVLLDLPGPSDGLAAMVRIGFVGAREVEPEGRDPLPQKATFLHGNDPAAWRTDVPRYREILYPDLYQGIALAYRGSENGPKYEFRVQPGADLRQLQLRYEGLSDLKVDADGTLIAKTAAGEFRDSPPLGLQSQPVACRFVPRGARSIGFDCPSRDVRQPLIVDPLIYATYLGGTDFDEIRSVVVDASGAAYVTGSTWSAAFPTTPGAYLRTHSGGLRDVFVAKLDPSGSKLSYATYLGGSGEEEAFGIAVDGGGMAYVTGYTTSIDFPTTPGALDRVINGTDAFIVKLNATGGALEYSTLLGGDLYDLGEAITVDSGGNAYLAGQTGSANFPTTPGALSRTYEGGLLDGFAAKVNPTGSGIVYGTYIGGFDVDGPWGIEIDRSGYAFVVGTTLSPDFPVTPGALSTTMRGTSDAFVLKLNPSGTGLAYGTFVGGSDQDTAYSAVIDSAGNAFVAGATRSPDFPATTGAFQNTSQGSTDGFALALNATGDGLVFGTYLGGLGEDEVRDLSLDAAGRLTVAGYTGSTNFPVTPGAINTTYLGGVYDAFVTRLNTSGTGLVYSSFLGGAGQDFAHSLALDGGGRAYLGGLTESSNFPVTPDAFGRSYAGARDAFVAGIALGFPIDFDTVPSGLSLSVDGDAQATPFRQVCDPGSTPSVHAPSPQVAGGSQYAFQVWSDGGGQTHGVPCTGPSTIVAAYVATDHRITIASSPAGRTVLVNGSAFLAPYAFWCPVGSLRAIDAPSPQLAGTTRFVFASWSDGGAQNHTIACTVASTYTANFGTEYAVTFTTSPPSRQVLIDGVLRTTPHSFWWPQGSLHTTDAPSPQVAGSTRFLFASWSDGGAQNHTITATAPGAYVATFITEHEVIVDTAPPGLQVRVDGNPFPAPSSYWCVEGSNHTVGVPSPQGNGTMIQYVFLSWSDGLGQNHTIGCPGPASYRAAFAIEFETRIETLPTSLSFEFDGTTYAAPWTLWCRDGSAHTLRAPSPQGTGSVRYSFLVWSDNGTQSHGIVCDEARSYTALFVTEYRLVIDTAPGGLALVVDGVDVTGPATFWWLPGSVHTLAIASPQGAGTSRHRWASWSDGMAQNHTLVVGAPGTFLATFIEEYRVSVETSPPGLRIKVDGVERQTPILLWFRDSHTFEGLSPQPGGFGTRYVFSSWLDGGPRIRVLDVRGSMSLLAVFTTQFHLRATSAFGTPVCDVRACWYDDGAMAVLQINRTEYGPPGERYQFARWTGDATWPHPIVAIRMDAPKNVTVDWTTEFFLRVVSPFGGVEGEGWYAEGATATFRLTAGEVTADGKRYRFARWTGDFNGSAPQGSLVMDREKQVVANWEALSFIEAAAWAWMFPLVVAVVLVLMFLFLKKREGSERGTEPSSQPEDDVDLDARAER